MDANELRVELYRYIVEHQRVPTRAELAAQLGITLTQTETALRQLAEAHALVLQPSGEVLMANPFSAVPTGFAVRVGGKQWWGNCIWDSLGIIAALGGEGEVETSCACCGLASPVRVASGQVQGAGIAHFAVPARHWWDDIVFN